MQNKKVQFVLSDKGGQKAWVNNYSFWKKRDLTNSINW